MNNELIKTVKKIGWKVRIHILETPHPTLIAFGVGAAITTGLLIGFAALSDPSHMAYAWVRKPVPD